MHRSVRWMVVLLGLPGIAAADDAPNLVAEQVPPGGEPAIERAETSGTSSPVFDLRVDPTQLRASPSAGPPVSEADRRNGDHGADPGVTDRGLSFGVELKPRSRVGGLARADEAEDDQLQRLMDHATLGLRGRYRF